MREFLEIVSIMIGELAQDRNISPQTECALQEGYEMFTVEEKKRVIQALDDIFGEEALTAIYIMSALLKTLQCGYISQYIEKKLLDNGVNLDEGMEILRKLQSYLFSSKITYESTQAQRKIVFQKYVECLNQYIISIPYVPYEKRKKRKIIMLIEPLLGERHSPTIILVNLYYYLQTMGYDVKICATNVRKLDEAFSANWYKPDYSSVVCEGTGILSEDYMGVKIEGMHILYDPKEYKKEMEAAKVWIYEENPEFVLSIGGMNYLAELCNEFTTVITIATSSDVPMTCSDYIVSYLRLNQKEEQGFIHHLEENQQYVSLEFVPILDPFDSDYDSISREKYGIAKKKFVLVLAGNRLDFEISEEFMKEVLQTIFMLNKNICCLVIGECPDFRKKVEEGSWSERFIFTGDVQEFAATIALGDVFLNPPRTGGGSGALYALKKNIPTICLPHGDVSFTVGSDFCCDRMEEMPKLVQRYFEDTKFREIQKANCEKRVKELFYADSKKNISKIFHDIAEDVKRKEEM